MARAKALRKASWWNNDSTGKSLSVFVAAGVFTTAIGAYGSYLATQKANTEMVSEQKRVNELAQFQASAKVLDNGIGAFSAALVDQARLLDSRDQLRAAVRQHSTDTEVLRLAFGSNTDEYLKKLTTLQDFTDQANKLQDAQPIWQTAADLISQRRQMIKQAESWTKQI